MGVNQADVSSRLFCSHSAVLEIATLSPSIQKVRSMISMRLVEPSHFWPMLTCVEHAKRMDQIALADADRFAEGWVERWLEQEDVATKMEQDDA